MYPAIDLSQIVSLILLSSVAVVVIYTDIQSVEFEVERSKAALKYLTNRVSVRQQQRPRLRYSPKPPLGQASVDDVTLKHAVPIVAIHLDVCFLD